MSGTTNASPLSEPAAGSLPIATLPCFASALFHAVHQIHGLWKYCTRFHEVAANASQFGQFIAGCLLNSCCEAHPCISVPARYVKITHCLLLCIKQQQAFSKSCEKLVKVFTKPCSPEPFRYVNFNWLTCGYPSSRPCIETLLNQMIDKIVKLSKSIFHFFADLFILSMRMMDLKDALSDTPEAEAENVQDFFLNCSSMLEELSENEANVHALLNSLGASYEVKPLTDCLSAGICTAGSICSAADYGKNKFTELCSRECGSIPKHNQTQSAFNTQYVIRA